MRIDCDIIKDLLPLYVEGLVSEKSKAALEEHLEECGGCDHGRRRQRRKTLRTLEPKNHDSISYRWYRLFGDNRSFGDQQENR